MSERTSPTETSNGATVAAVPTAAVQAKTSILATIGLWLRRAGPSVGFLGYFPFASGTVGSAVAIGAIWFAHAKYPAFFGVDQAAYYWIAIVAITALSIFLASKPQQLFGSSDPKQVIIDEVAGQFITFFMIPISWRTLLLGFLLFRLFDIVKPFPVHKMEEMEEGVGITMDDVVAGVFANISLFAILWAYSLVRAALNS